MKHPLITTIIPTYKRPQLLKRALASVLSQTYPHFQLSVYDNASHDETEAVVREFMEKDNRVKYHCHEQNIGMIANYQFAMSQVNTPLFSLLSDDDVLFPWFYEETLKGFELFPESAFSASSTAIVNESGKTVLIPLDSWSREGYFSVPEGLIEMIPKYPVPNTVLFKREMIEQIPIDTNNILAWDCDFLIQIAMRFPFFITKKKCGIFLQHTSSFSNSQNMRNWMSAQHQLINRLESSHSISIETRERAISLINQNLKMIVMHFVIRHLMKREKKEARWAALFFRQRYGISIKSMTFLILTKMDEYCIPFFRLLLFVRAIKRLIKNMKYKAKNPQEDFAQWL
jgi:glycosyltransferase involved in cell wall biosynthesis